jgi:hypothetical protein
MASTERLIADIETCDELLEWQKRISLCDLADGRLLDTLLRERANGHEAHVSLWGLTQYEHRHDSDVLSRSVGMLIEQLLTRQVTSHEAMD